MDKITPESEEAEITVMLKGGGSEAPSLAKTIAPGLGIKGALKIAIDDVFEAGAKPCPPVTIGVGLGPTGDIAMKLAKKALLRPIGDRNPKGSCRIRGQTSQGLKRFRLGSSRCGRKHNRFGCTHRDSS